LFGSEIGSDTFFGSDGSTGSTVIIEYNQVGKSISGTFSGSLISSQANSLTISGSFSVVRLPDENGVD
jgi:hypothetical protein